MLNGIKHMRYPGRWSIARQHHLYRLRWAFFCLALFNRLNIFLNRYFLITVVKPEWTTSGSHWHLGTAPVLATDGDYYEFAPGFPEALLSLSILYWRIQPVAASMKYLIQFMWHDQPWISSSAESWRCSRILFVIQPTCENRRSCP